MAPSFPLTRTVCTEYCCWIQDCPFPAFIHIKHVRIFFFFLYSEGVWRLGVRHVFAQHLSPGFQASAVFPREPASAQAGLLRRPASAPSSSWARLLGPWARRVVGQEEALGGAAPHGAVRVQEQAREAVSEVLDEAVGGLA